MDKHTRWALRCEKVVGMEMLTLAILADYADKSGRCYPGMSTIGRRIGKGRRQVIRYLSALKAKGLVTWETREKGTKKDTNLYQIIMEGTAKAPRSGDAKIALSSDDEMEKTVKGFIAEWNQLPYIQRYEVQSLDPYIKADLIRRLRQYPDRDFWRTKFFAALKGPHFSKTYPATLPWALDPKNFNKITRGYYATNPHRQPQYTR